MIIVRLLSSEPVGWFGTTNLLGYRSRHCHGINSTHRKVSVAMTSTPILDTISQLNDAQRLEWLVNLGWEMTVSARAAYPNSTMVNDKLSYLIAFNEIQH